MKIITLNTWCGRHGNSIYDFFKKYRDIDIFCLQEVDLDGTRFGPEVTHSDQEKQQEFQGDPKLFDSIDAILKDHIGYFSPILDRWWGNAIFIKKSFFEKITASGELIVSDKQQQYVEYSKEQCWFNRKIQWLDFEKNDQLYTLVNFHGLWEKNKGKSDSYDRIQQSNVIAEFLETKKKRNIILIGDFNLNPDTKSIKILENFPLRNLITENGINDTRTSIYKKENRYADYALVSPGMIIKEFKVLPDEVSDHAPLYLEID